MARSRRTTPTIPTEIPLDPKPRRKKPKAIAEVLDTLKVPGLTTAAELAPPEREVIEPTEQPRPRPTSDRNGTEYPRFAEKAAASRPTNPIGPRKRDGDPAASFASKDIRITLQDRVWQVEARRELTGNEKDRLAASGFHAVDDDEHVWNAPRAELVRRGIDINVVAYELSGKAARGR